MNKNIAVILNGPIKNDARVIRIVNSLSKIADVDLYYTKSKDINDTEIFKKKNIALFNIQYPNTLYQKFLQNTFFYKEFEFFIPVIKKNNKKYDIIYCNDLPTLKVGFVLKKSYNSKLIYDSHEIYNATINQFFIKGNNVIKNNIFELLIFFMKLVGNKFERKLKYKVDFMLTVNESLKDYFIDKHNPQKIDYLYNTPELKTNNNVKINFKNLLNFQRDDIIILYQGVLNKGRGLEVLIDSIAKTTNKRLKLIIIGYGILSQVLKEKVNHYGIADKIKFLGLVEERILHNYTKQADWGIFFLESYNISTQLASPNKIFQYIHAEIPIFTNFSPENDKIFNKYEIGYQVDFNIKNISEKMNTLSTKNDYFIFKKNCKIAKSNLNWEEQELKLLNIINSL